VRARWLGERSSGFSGRAADASLCATVGVAPLAAAFTERLYPVGYGQHFQLWVQQARRAALGGMRRVAVYAEHRGPDHPGGVDHYSIDLTAPDEDLSLSDVPALQPLLQRYPLTSRSGWELHTRRAFAELLATLLLLFGDRIFIDTAESARGIRGDELRALVGDAVPIAVWPTARRAILAAANIQAVALQRDIDAFGAGAD
jgi:hypothetical protein